MRQQSDWQQTAWEWVCGAIVAAVVWYAAHCLGYLFGWLIGGSKTPAVTSVAPLLFGLLAVLGVSAGARFFQRRAPSLKLKQLHSFKELSRELQEAMLEEARHMEATRPSPAWRLCLDIVIVAGAIVVFCFFCERGLRTGIRSRVQPYGAFADLLGKGASTLRPETSAALYRFRWRCQQDRIRGIEFDQFITDVIRPITAANSADADKQIERALAEFSTEGEALP